MPNYRVTHTGNLDYPPNKTAKPGDVVSDLPPASVRWLLRDGLIEDVTEAPKPASPGPQPDDTPRKEATL